MNKKKIAAMCAAGALVLTAGAIPAEGDGLAMCKDHRPVVVPQAVVETAECPEAAENELIEAALLARAHVIENCKVTYYDAHCVKCCNKTDGVTASGIQAVPYVTCAVDTAIIPFGADVLVDYGDGVLHYYRADDTGVAGAHIDVCVTSHSEALWLGLDRATVYWAAE